MSAWFWVIVSISDLSVCFPVPQFFQRPHIVSFDAKHVRLVLLKCSSASENRGDTEDVRRTEKRCASSEMVNVTFLPLFLIYCKNVSLHTAAPSLYTTCRGRSSS